MLWRLVFFSLDALVDSDFALTVKISLCAWFPLCLSSPPFCLDMAWELYEQTGTYQTQHLPLETGENKIYYRSCAVLD